MRTSTWKSSIYGKKAYLWFTIFYFLALEIIRWVLDWKEFEDYQTLYNLPVEFNYFLNEMVKYTIIHWEPELLLLIYKMAAFVSLVYIGTLIYKEDKEAPEKTIDQLLKKIDPDNYSKTIKEWKEKYK